MMNPDLVSIVMPVWNAEAYVGEALACLQRQSLSHWQLIVVDDASTDDTLAVIERMGDARVRILRNSDKQGLAPVLNQGLAAAEGQYVARMDADDVCHPRRLQQQVAFLSQHTTLAACGSWCRVFGAGRSFVFRYASGVGMVRAYALFDSPLCHPTVMFNRAVIAEEDFSYLPSQTLSEDYELWLRLLRRYDLDNIPRVLLRYRRHPDTTTTTGWSCMNDLALDLLRGELRTMGLEATDRELQLHRAIGRGSGFDDADGLRVAKAWMVKVEARNREVGYAPQQEMHRALGMLWFRTCMNSAARVPGAWGVYRDSLWHAVYRPSLEECAAVLLSTLRRRLSR